MNKYFVKYKCKDDKYDSTINIMTNYYETDIIICDWYISEDVGILILESKKNSVHIKLKLNKYFNIIDFYKINRINDWLNENDSFK